VSPHTWKRRDN